MNRQDKKEYERLKRFYEQRRDKMPAEKQNEIISHLRQDITNAFSKNDSESLGALIEKCGNYTGKYPEMEKSVDKLVRYFQKKGAYEDLFMIRYLVGKIAESCKRPENIAFSEYMEKKINTLSPEELSKRMTI
jgi:hypothetical protein